MLAQARIGRSDVTVSCLGLGCASLGNLYTPVSDAQSRDTVTAALEVGVRYFDTAPYYGYGLSEQRLGSALAARSEFDVVVSSKVGRLLEPRPSGPRQDQGFANALPFDAVFDYTHDGVMRSLEASLSRSGLSRIDILLLHDIGSKTHGAVHRETFEVAMQDGYRALERLRGDGTVGAIGLGVNEWEVCVEAMERGDFDCFLLAGRYTLLEQGALAHFLPACAKREISVIVGGPYNSGILASEPRTDSRYDYAAADPTALARAQALHAVCESHGVPLPSAALQFPLLHPAVACVIPGARSRAEVEANAAHLEHKIPNALWRDLVSEGLLNPAAPVIAAMADS